MDETIAVALKINGTVHALRIELRVSLLDVRHEFVGLIGTKKGYQSGCGACTVLVDGTQFVSSDRHRALAM